MKDLGNISSQLRRKNKKNYTLLSGCIFFSVLLITAYVSIMRSPTVLAILPDGGDSRRQVMMIFALAAVGCGVLAIYSASIFFRYKSREVGIFLMLGASRSRISKQLFKEIAIVAVSSCLAGAILGTPIAWVIWQLFRIFIVDTEEMSLSFDPQAYLFALVFTVFILAALFIMGARFIKHTNIIDIVNRQHMSEPVHDVKPWYGPLGIILIAVGGFAGYIVPTISLEVFHRYAQGWTNIFYLPLFIGLYMVLVHTVVHGWKQGKSRYKNIISRSMMKFQGRQTVNSMLVITVLIAGAYFAAFYSPMMGSSQQGNTESRPVDYAFHYRADNKNMLTRSDIEKMASKGNVDITGWKDTQFAVLGNDGNTEISEGNGKFHYEYRKLLGGNNYISESSFNKMTGQNAGIEHGRFAEIITEDGAGKMDKNNKTLLTNMTTQKTLSLSFQQYLRFNMLASTYDTAYYVLDDADYAEITDGLADEWREKLVYFNVKDDLNTYNFAKKLFHSIVKHSAPECAVCDMYNFVGKAVSQKAGETYFGDEYPEMTEVDYAKPDSSMFRMHWKYMPQFRVLDKYDFIKEYAVFFMVFIFISIVCFAAVLLIGYTRCITIAMNNRQVYDDLRHLGASQKYIRRTVKGQVSKVFGVPAFVGTLLTFAFFIMILSLNDGRIIQSEISALITCFFIVLGLSAVIWAFYRHTLNKVYKMLKITI